MTTVTVAGGHSWRRGDIVRLTEVTPEGQRHADFAVVFVTGTSFELWDVDLHKAHLLFERLFKWGCWAAATVYAWVAGHHLALWLIRDVLGG